MEHMLPLIESFKIIVTRFIPTVAHLIYRHCSSRFFNKAQTACRAATELLHSGEAYRFSRTSNMQLCKLSITRFIISKICINMRVLEAQLGQSMDFRQLGSSYRLSKSQAET